MWELYAQFLSERLEITKTAAYDESQHSKKREKRKKGAQSTDSRVQISVLELLGLFRRAEQARALTEKMFGLWVQTLLALPDVKQALMVCETSLKAEW